MTAPIHLVHPNYRPERWPVNWAAAVGTLRRASQHLAKQSPEIVHPLSRHPDREAVRVLSALETVVEIGKREPEPETR